MYIRIEGWRYLACIAVGIAGGFAWGWPTGIIVAVLAIILVTFLTALAGPRFETSVTHSVEFRPDPEDEPQLAHAGAVVSFEPYVDSVTTECNDIFYEQRTLITFDDGTTVDVSGHHEMPVEPGEYLEVWLDDRGRAEFRV